MVLGEIGRRLRRAAKGSPFLAEAYRRARALRHRARMGRDVGGAGATAGGVEPGNIVWIFGSGRSGSTWLRSMMGEVRGHEVWEEPMVGRLFGEFYGKAPEENRRSADFVMGEPIREGWIRSVRNFVLDGTAYSNPGLGPKSVLVVKEPNGSVGAPLLMEALPESRMVLLVRDPRDVVASVLDAARKGGWLYESRNGGAGGTDGAGARGSAADNKPNAFVRERARVYRRGVEAAKEAYDAHNGPKALIRYEDLRADPSGTMRRLYSEIGIAVDDPELSRAVQKHAWENVPEDEKGRGKARRKARPGSWREDLTPKQAEIVEKATAALLAEFYPKG